MNISHSFDVIIVGAGPAGSATALALHGSGLKVALLDRAFFPRDKICGDAVSADVVKQLGRFPIPSLPDTFRHFAAKQGTQGVRFVGPDGARLELEFKAAVEGHAPGYVSKREDFDHFLFTEAAALPEVNVFQHAKVDGVEVEADHITVQAGKTTWEAPIAVGADGAQSILARQLQQRKPDPHHDTAGVRQYYEGVGGLSETPLIELHFLREVRPGYFWIFPLPNNQANVGLGMLSEAVARRKANLRQLLPELVATHPDLAPRFAQAKALEPVRGFGLPMGSARRAASGARYLLTGDAASLIDPFTGEGIGNALRSGRVAADVIQEAFASKDFSADFLKRHDREIYRRMGREFQVSRGMQRMARHTWLINWVIGRASRNPSLQKLLTAMLDDVDLKQELTRPGFYWRLLSS